eukprot:CAMPEP_0201527968 /NCGR_PEP_ID=MMETSP0161_2-20130828/36937_1 /ASSEMBLY_ACC=CAM_ASM_000251 /TAXON_ID=180227 /ORGANISM="Neoparamoeba aestuarina, Strain SoJaBio B1-5/56/2" /LENGTH=251 /DNA_ID=CAMNT_0047929037 /DNA_START=73 /DNA_END=825 /DNA_ORIENTATION=-
MTEYASNYTQHLLPYLPYEDQQQMRYRFFDMGSAPGGLCQAILQWKSDKHDRNKWVGVAVTLDPADGGIPMKYKNDSLEVRFADVQTGEKFLEQVVRNDDVGAYAFVNMGIVVDQNVKRYLDSAKPYCEQLITQLRATKLVLKEKGSFMMVLNLDYPSLPEVMRTISILLRNAENVHIIPTVYTKTAARKQFYLLVNGVTLTSEVVDELSQVWQKAHERRVTRKRRLQEPDDAEKVDDSPAASSEAKSVID